jgi:hypothetical protein
MVEQDIWQGDFSNRFEDREYAIEVFNRHIAQVKEQVPKQRLLVYEVSRDGSHSAVFWRWKFLRTSRFHDSMIVRHFVA